MPLKPEQVVKALMQQRAQLVGYAWAVVGDPHAAEDILQDISMLAVSKCSEIQDLEHLSGWFRHAIRLRGMEVRRSLAKRSTRHLSGEILEILDDAWSQMSTARESERMDALRRCIGMLKGSAQQVVELRYAKNMPAAEIAQHTGQRVETVYKSITRTHTALRDCINNRLSEQKGGDR